MRALLYLLTLTLCCFLKNVNCVITFEDFKKDLGVMHLVANYHNNNGIKTQLDLLKELNNMGLEMSISTLNKYLKEIEKEAGGGSRKKAFERFKNDPRAMDLVNQFNNNKITDTELLEALQRMNPKMNIKWMYLYLARLDQEKDADGGTLNLQATQIAQQSSTSGNPGSSRSALNKGISTKFGGGNRKITFQRFKDDSRAMDLVKQFNNNEITDTALSGALKQINHKMSINSMRLYLARLDQEQKAGDTSYLQAPQIAQQSSDFTSGNPGSSRSASEKGKSTNFSKKNSDNWPLSSITGFGATAHLPNQSQSTEMLDFSNPAPPFPQAPQFARQSFNFTSGNPGSSTSESNKGKSINFSKASNSGNWPLSSITGLASHYGDAMPSQQAPMDDTFAPSQTGTDSMNWFEENLQNNDGDLESMIRNTSSSEGFDTTPFLLNQLQSTGWPGASNYFSPTPNTSNFTSGNPGSSAISFQQAPMPGTSFPSFPNQSAQLNSSTNFGPSQNETNWSGGNSQ